MKREIKFRALKDDMSNCTFVYGQLIYRKEELSGNAYPSITEDGILFSSCLPNTESQFTGLTDKNGKEIYEGDILKARTFMYSVVYENASYYLYHYNGLKEIDGSPYRWGILTRIKELGFEIEIIGNVYENPELLTT